MRQALIALVLAPVLFVSAHASAAKPAAAPMDKAAAKMSFKAALSKDGALRSYHRGQLFKAGVKSTMVGSTTAVGTLFVVGRTTHSMSTAIAGSAAAGTVAGVAHFKMKSLPAARSNTVAFGVARGTIKPHQAAQLEAAGFVDSRWQAQANLHALISQPAKQAKQ